jgi:DNA-directed RNA polymerase subunit RPC12/RpoP
MRYSTDINVDFKCLHCGFYVSVEALLAGVQNRNHCPYCLWSRHLDWFQAGDRLSACKAAMRPLGLTLKRCRNKYAAVAGGELMLVHQCSECERISINRIAADDVPEAIIEVFEASLSLSLQVQNQIRMSGIHLLGRTDIDLIYRQLYGQLSPS